MIKPYYTVSKEPKEMKLKDDKVVFGKVKEISSISKGARQASIAEVTLWGPDILHYHKKAEETYYCVSGKGEIFLNGKILEFERGTSVIIRPGTVHASRPNNPCGRIVFLCVSSPPFNRRDVYNDRRGRKW